MSETQTVQVAMATWCPRRGCYIQWPVCGKMQSENQRPCHRSHCQNIDADRATHAWRRYSEERRTA